MKLDPLSVLFNKNIFKDKSLFLISGNDESYIHRVRDSLVDYFMQKGDYYLEKLEKTEGINESGGLFSSKKINIVKNIKESDLLLNNDLNNIYIFISPNSPKNKSLKLKAAKSSNFSLVDCYALDKNTKMNAINLITNKNQSKLEKDIYWYLVDLLDDKFVFLENQMDKILLLGEKKNNLENIKILIDQNLDNPDKIFFSIFESNKKLINLYNEKVSDYTILLMLFNSIKRYLYLIIDSENDKIFLSSIPKYLFKEKDIFLKIFKSIDSAKKTKIIKTLMVAEMDLRKNNQLAISLGLRFVLNLRRIIIS